MNQLKVWPSSQEMKLLNWGRKTKSVWKLKVRSLHCRYFESQLEILLDLAQKQNKREIIKRQKLRGSNIFLKAGDIVYELTPEEDGWIKVRTTNGEEGEIPVTCIKGFSWFSTLKCNCIHIFLEKMWM